MNIIRNGLIAMMVMMTSIATASELQFKMLEGYGYWKTVVAEDDDFPIICTITSELGNNSAFLINFSYLPEQSLSIDLIKDTWKIPADLKTKIRFTFDNKAPYIFNANGADFNNKGLIIDMYENGVDIEIFMTMFTSSRNLVIEFEGAERNWILNLTGTRQAVSAFHKCVNTLPKENPFDEPTQPFQEFNGPRQSHPYMFKREMEDLKLNPSKIRYF